MAKAYDHLKGKMGLTRLFYKAPAIMAVIVRQNGNYAVAATSGVRKADLPEDAAGNKTADSDAFPIGSCSKPISGYMLAVLLKLTQYNWETTIGEVFPELNNPWFRKLYYIRDDYLRASIRDMMTHTARFRYAPTRGTYESLKNVIGNFKPQQVEEYCSREAEMRRRYNYALTSQQDSPGALGVYNGGPILPVAMAERITGKSYQKLMREYVFDPLDMKETRIGRPATPASPPDGIWPHSFDFSALKFVPNSFYVAKVKHYDAHLPAGGINLSAGDAVRFISAQFVNGTKNRPLKGTWLEDTFAPYANGFSVSGWITSGGPKPNLSVSHDGDDGANRARIKIWPYKGEGFAVCTNGGGEGKLDDVEEFNIGLQIVNAVSKAIEDMLTNWNTDFPGE